MACDGENPAGGGFPVLDRAGIGHARLGRDFRRSERTGQNLDPRSGLRIAATAIAAHPQDGIDAIEEAIALLEGDAK